jgi:hypothetical protein
MNKIIIAMKNLIKKEEALIKLPIEAFIKNYLANDFKTSANKKVLKVNNVSIANILVDAALSEFKVQIVINNLDIFANVNEEFTATSYRATTLNLRVTNQINLSYNFRSKAYQIINQNELVLVDITNF